MRARDRAAGRGVRVNAIGIGRLPCGGAAFSQAAACATPADWLPDNAVTAGGFSIDVRDWGGFTRAMRRKLQMELASR